MTRSTRWLNRRAPERRGTSIAAFRGVVRSARLHPGLMGWRRGAETPVNLAWARVSFAERETTMETSPPASTSTEIETKKARLFTKLCTNQANSRERVALSLVVCKGASEARTSSLRARINRRLNAGRLPHNGVAVTHGAPGVGGYCAACDRLLTPRHLTMSVPFRQGFVYLHADCFLIWNAVRKPRLITTDASDAAPRSSERVAPGRSPGSASTGTA